MIGKLLRIVAAAVVLAAAALIGWRVLAPAEVFESSVRSGAGRSDGEPATGAYPVAVTLPPGVTGKTTLAPLIVDGRIRVYAGERLVKADGPVEAKTMSTARWSYRRWPERLTGIVAVAATVVTRWSDGDVVALDGRTGELAWRAGGPAAEPFAGRTGSAAVWAPPGLHTAGTSVLITDGRQLIARAAADGTQRWAVPLPPGCGDGFVTTGGRYVCGAGAWDVLSGTVVRGWPTGPFTAVGCDVARSGCAGLRDGSGQGWLTGARRPERAPALDAPDATAAADLVLTVSGGGAVVPGVTASGGAVVPGVTASGGAVVPGVTASGGAVVPGVIASGGAVTASGGAVVASRAGREVWRWSGAARVLGVRGGRAVLLAADRRLIVLDAATGVLRAEFPLYVPKERVEAWKPDRWQLTDGYLAVERLQPSAGTDPDEANHFYTTDPVVIAAL
ncbi:PQQ-binding-like beta-propeller repeat protein [Actinoplanes sp. ATCC 53533]|uniref:outer membrane protein assembly factor BamB family protein n=1 Tax=Actinoplanes sp. ATCC 53533 TaxID=1288362 RepID=UPI000F779960|nr:PQQ-binding-like beta-propeller repeat protein [Actinoplanes sp. ATCC 53533]